MTSTVDIPDLHPPDDYSHRFFIWHEWIQANGPLNADNVFEYFATSMFYDKQSNNQVLRMQTMHTGVPLVNEAEELRRFTGVEFAVVHSEPPGKFIIHKRERLSPDEVRPLAVYFIMNNRIYQSPDLYTILSNRLLTSLSALQHTMDTLRRHRPDYLPRTGFMWPVNDTATNEDPKKVDDTQNTDLNNTQETAAQTSLEKSEGYPLAEGPKKQQNNMLMLNAMRTTAAHSKLPTATSFAALDLSTTGDTPASAGPRPPSMTPAPASQQLGSGDGSQNTSGAQEPPAKGPPGLGKKKKKRTLPVS